MRYYITPIAVGISHAAVTITRCIHWRKISVRASIGASVYARCTQAMMLRWLR